MGPCTERIGLGIPAQSENTVGELSAHKIGPVAGHTQKSSPVRISKPQNASTPGPFSAFSVTVVVPCAPRAVLSDSSGNAGCILSPRPRGVDEVSAAIVWSHCGCGFHVRHA